MTFILHWWARSVKEVRLIEGKLKPYQLVQTIIKALGDRNGHGFSMINHK
jgi:hypothetical protein